jgi:predicted metal-dependent peptidase
MATSVKIEKELIKGIVDIARHKEFYGHIIQQVERIFVDEKHTIQTAAVGRVPGDRFIKMYLSRKFFTDIYEENSREKAWIFMLGVLEHEILHCFPAGTMVGGSFLPIEKMVKGNNIIGSDGCIHEAEQVEERNYAGGLVSIKPMGVIGFDVTDNHKILVADIGWKTINTDFPRRSVRLIKNIDWKNSQDVKTGDWLAVPRMKGNRSDSEIDVMKYIRGNKWSLPIGVRGGSIPLNVDTAWLMGYYCAEGSASSIGARNGGKSSGSGQITFSMNKDECLTHGSKVKEIVNKWQLGGCPFFSGENGNGCTIVFNSTVVARLFHDKIGRGAENKRVPDEIFWHKDERILKAFLRGYFDGDGAVKSSLFASATVSRVLAYQIQMMAARLGAWMNMHFDELSKLPPKVIVSGPPRIVKDQYRLHSGGDDIRGILGYDTFESKKRATKHHVMTDDYIFIQVKGVARRGWAGKVYNLRSPTRDYLVSNVVVHNCIFGHLFLYFQDHLRGNVAKDLVVNGIIPNDTLPGNYVIPEHYGFERGKSSMWYYTHLADNKKFKQQCADGQFGEGGVLSHIMSSHKMWDDIKDDLLAKEFAKDIIQKAKDLCNKQYGNIPGEVLNQIEELLKKKKPIIPWGKVLRLFVASCSESVLDYTIKKFSRRFSSRPGTRIGDVLNIAVGIDTSGSISDEQLKIFFNEIRWLWKNGVNVTIYEADCKVCKVYKFKGKFNGKVHGRGGTDLEPVLKEVEGKYDALIYFTDFCAPTLSRVYKIPTLWVLHGDMGKESYPAKWGKHVRITDGKAEAA